MSSKATLCIRFAHLGTGGGGEDCHQADISPHLDLPAL